MSLKIAIQGYPGSFHDEAAHLYWQDRAFEIVPADSFDILGRLVASGEVDAGIMAIENSIAGTILQNYRILREHKLWVSGEIYLRIRHHLLANIGASTENILEVESHPMAINQCRRFLDKFPHWKIIESDDTALSARRLKESGETTKACIAGRSAADLYQLNCLAESIETHPTNYTRFFTVQNQRIMQPDKADKASVYVRIPDKKGQLLQVLALIHRYDINMSKLQSFPITGSFREYYFHLDLEFDQMERYLALKSDLSSMDFAFEELGLYQRADTSAILHHSEIKTETSC
ncbi:MAG: hypothetical protein IPM26_09750 [Saprospiraceae bacterium]|nr:hypothetical protein [Saprospiraceae bacterium]